MWGLFWFMQGKNGRIVFLFTILMGSKGATI